MSNSRFLMGNKNVQHSSVKLLYVGSSKYGDDWSSSLHSHFYTEMFFVKSGSGLFRVEDSIFDIRENNLVLVNPNIEHTEMSTAAGSMEYIVVGMEGLGFQFHSRNADRENRYRLLDCREERGVYLACLGSMLNELKTKPPRYEIFCQNALENFLILLMRKNDMSLRAVSGRRSSRECAHIKRYIDANYKSPLTLEDLAREAHVNKYYLVHTFTSENGISPISYLVRRRIRESKYFLEDTDYSISQIAQYTGFTSPSYFSQAFKQAEGCSPNRYRTIHRKC